MSQKARSTVFPGLIIAALALGAAAPALAYVPPSLFILKGMVNKHSGLKAVRIRSTVTQIEDGKPTDARFQLQTWVNYATGTMQLWSQDDSGQILHYSQSRLESLPARSAVLLGSRLGPVAEALKVAGVPVITDAELSTKKSEEEKRALEVTFLKRFKNQFAWVIGDPSKPVSQLWVEKDAFIPLRFIGPENEVRFEQTRFQREFPFPRLISLLKGDAVLLTEEVKEVQINPDSPRERAPSRGDANGLTAAGDNASSRVKELLQRYHDLVR